FLRWNVERGAISDPSARPTAIVRSTAARLATGSAPGCAVQAGQMRVLGSPPDSFGQRQNILLRVESCTWISRPITPSQPAGALPRLPLARAGGGRTRMRARARGRLPAAGSR